MITDIFGVTPCTLAYRCQRFCKNDFLHFNGRFYFCEEGEKQQQLLGKSGYRAKLDWAVLFGTAFGSALALVNFVGLHCYCIVSLHRRPVVLYARVCVCVCM